MADMKNSLDKFQVGAWHLCFGEDRAKKRDGYVVLAIGLCHKSLHTAERALRNHHLGTDLQRRIDQSALLHGHVQHHLKVGHLFVRHNHHPVRGTVEKIIEGELIDDSEVGGLLLGGHSFMPEQDN